MTTLSKIREEQAKCYGNFVWKVPGHKETQQIFYEEFYQSSDRSMHRFADSLSGSAILILYLPVSQHFLDACARRDVVFCIAGKKTFLKEKGITQADLSWKIFDLLDMYMLDMYMLNM